MGDPAGLGGTGPGFVVERVAPDAAAVRVQALLDRGALPAPIVDRSWSEDLDGPWRVTWLPPGTLGCLVALVRAEQRRLWPGPETLILERGTSRLEPYVDALSTARAADALGPAHPGEPATVTLAITDLARALDARDPEAVVAHTGAGCALQTPSVLEALLSAALGWSPTREAHLWLLLRLGAAVRRQGRPQEAAEIHEEARPLAVTPSERAELRLQLAILALNEGEQERAEALLAAIHTADCAPETREAVTLLRATSLGRRGDLAAALAILEGAPEPRGATVEAQLLSTRDQLGHDGALDALRDLRADHDADRAHVTSLLAACLLRRGCYAEAEPAVRASMRCAALAGRHLATTHALIQLGGLLRMRGELEEARETWQRAKALGSRVAPLNLAILDLRAGSTTPRRPWPRTRTATHATSSPGSRWRSACWAQKTAGTGRSPAPRWPLARPSRPPVRARSTWRGWRPAPGPAPATRPIRTRPPARSERSGSPPRSTSPRPPPPTARSWPTRPGRSPSIASI